MGTYTDADGDGICAALDQDDTDDCVPNANGINCIDDQVDCRVINATGFENRDMGVWIDGGRSATILSSVSFANTGNYSFYIQANDGRQSSLYTSDLNLSGAESVLIQFNVYPYFVEFEDSFVLEVSTGGDYSIIKEYVTDVDFTNLNRQDISEFITGIDFTTTTSFRLRSTTDHAADYFIFDDITIEACQSGSAPLCRPGSACDDGDSCTTGDVYDADCNCAGNIRDADNDGICDDLDTCPNLNDALIGTPCDDGDNQTIDDIYTSNCTCEGDLQPADEIDCASLTNVGLGKTASQSSTEAHSNDFDAGNALDGNRDGHHRNNSISHTQTEQNAWWEVDLGQIYNLDFVKIWNRTNCCADRLTDFHVLVSDVPFNSNNLNNTINQNGVGDFHFPGTAGRETDINLARTGRYIRIQLSGEEALQLAEVEIMGCGNSSGGATSGCDVFSDIDFESGLDIWNDGGGDCALLANDDFSNSGSGSVRLRDNSGVASSMFTDVLDFSSADEVVISFSFLPISFETNEDFFFDVSVNGGSAFAVVKNWVVGNDFVNGERQQTQVTLNRNQLSSNTVFRIRCDASGNADLVYIDDIVIESCISSGSVSPTTVAIDDTTVSSRSTETQDENTVLGPITIAPNPTSDFITLDLSHYMEKSIGYKLISMTGEAAGSEVFDANHSALEKIDLNHLSNGTYIILFQTENKHVATQRVVVLK